MNCEEPGCDYPHGTRCTMSGCPGFKRRTAAGFSTLLELTGRVGALPAAPGHPE